MERKHLLDLVGKCFVGCQRALVVGLGAAAAAFWICCAPMAARAAGLYRDGSSASSMGLGGNTVAGADNPLDAMETNPATLSDIRGPTLQTSVIGADAEGVFHNRVNAHSVLGQDGLLGNVGAATAAGPWHFGFSVNPEIALAAQWRYRDAPGGLDGHTSYGVQPQDSGIVVVRLAFGASWDVNPQLSLGASVGLLYNQNHMRTPYVFQTQPALRNVKTLFDLDTDGVGVDGQVGLLWKPLEALQLGLSYRTPSRVVTDGQATGNAGVQLANLGLGAARHDFNYDATVTNVFPQQVNTGFAWKVTGRLTALAEMDWINWANAFDTLPVHLKGGKNALLNELVGSRNLYDHVPLDWRNQFVWRLGAEYALDDHWRLRIGYASARSSVPADTLTPLTASIPENILTAGIGYRRDRLSIDLAYQFELPETERVGRTALAAGEYSNSSVRIEEQWLSLTTTIGF